MHRKTSSEGGLSPVLRVILVVAVTVLLAGCSSGLDPVSNVLGEDPKAAVTFDQDGSAVTVMAISLENADSVSVVVDDTEQGTIHEVGYGAAIEVTGLSPGDTLVAVARVDGREAVFQTFTVSTSNHIPETTPETETPTPEQRDERCVAPIEPIPHGEYDITYTETSGSTTAEIEVTKLEKSNFVYAFHVNEIVQSDKLIGREVGDTGTFTGVQSGDTIRIQSHLGQSWYEADHYPALKLPGEDDYYPEKVPRCHIEQTKITVP